MSKPSANLRLFVAVYPPPEIAAAMVECLSKLRLPPHRATALEQVHLTMQFIGDVPAKDVDATIESVQRATSGLRAFVLAPLRLLTLPERGPARLVALETNSPPDMLELHRRLVTRLARHPRARAEERFRPHFTLSRLQSPTAGLRIDDPVHLKPFEIAEVQLMRSTLSPAGAQHHSMIACKLESK